MGEAVQHSLVPRDETLDAFPSKSASEEGADSSPVGSGDDAPSVETTSDWSPEGAPCASCGTVVSRRWRQDGDLVCPSCKNWNGE